MSVIIPARNAGSTLEACLRSLASQSHRPEEIIVGDNESSDATASLAASAGAKVVAVPGKRGPGPVRNAAAEVATGDVLAFIDADCEAPPDWLASLLGPLDARPEAVATAGTAYGKTPVTLAEKLQDLLFPPDGSAEEIRAFRTTREGVVTNSLAVKRVAFKAAGGFDERLRWLEDVAFPAALLKATGGMIVRVPAAAVVHHVPTRVRECLQRAWKYGLSSATLVRVLWPRKTLIQVTRRLTLDTDRLPGRVWILTGPDKVLAVAALLGVVWAPAWTLGAVALLYYWLDLKRRAQSRKLPLGFVETWQILGIDIVYHTALTAGRLAGSFRGRSLCL